MRVVSFEMQSEPFYGYASCTNPLDDAVQRVEKEKPEHAEMASQIREAILLHTGHSRMKKLMAVAILAAVKTDEVLVVWPRTRGNTYQHSGTPATLFKVGCQAEGRRVEHPYDPSQRGQPAMTRQEVGQG